MKIRYFVGKWFGYCFKYCSILLNYMNKAFMMGFFMLTLVGLGIAVDVVTVTIDNHQLFTELNQYFDERELDILKIELSDINEGMKEKLFYVLIDKNKNTEIIEQIKDYITFNETNEKNYIGKNKLEQIQSVNLELDEIIDLVYES